jgi:hypothetical protein
MACARTRTNVLLTHTTVHHRQHASIRTARSRVHAQPVTPWPRMASHVVTTMSVQLALTTVTQTTTQLVPILQGLSLAIVRQVTALKQRETSSHARTTMNVQALATLVIQTPLAQTTPAHSPVPVSPDTPETAKPVIVLISMSA